MASSSLFLLFCSCLLLLISVFVSAGDGGAKTKVPAIYVFGDSTVDVGNNNYLPGKNSKANFPPYGIDFPRSRPTGRYSNGYNGADFLASLMGFKRSPPPFLSLANKTSSRIMKGLGGVSFASGGSGILDSTGNTLTFSKQIKSFTSVQSELITRMDEERTKHLLSKSVFIISTGGNDLFAYFSQSTVSNSTQSAQFVATLISTYKDYLKALYKLGARKFGIINVPPLGCCPYPRSLNPTGDCIEMLNQMAKVFNQKQKLLLQKLSLSMPGMKYSIGSSYDVLLNTINSPAVLGFKESKAACCGAGRYNAESGCTPNVKYCSNGITMCSGTVYTLRMQCPSLQDMQYIVAQPHSLSP